MRAPSRILSDLSAFRKDALAFFQQHNLYATGEVRVDFGLRAARVIAAPQLAQEVMTHASFEKRERPYGPLGILAGQGSLRWLTGRTLPVLDAQEAKDRRSILRPIHVQVARALRKRSLASVDWSNVPPGRHDLYMLVSSVVFDLLCRALFGQTYPEAHDRVAHAVSNATDALDVASKSLQPYACTLGPSAQALRSSRHVLLEFAQRVYADLSALPESSPVPMRRLVTSTLTQREAVDEILTNIVAGLETTTITCCWCIVQLLRHPHILQRIRNADPEDKRTWIGWSILETLRQYPAFWTLIRIPTVPCILQGSSFSRGEIVFVSPFLIHHNPKHWTEPERFLPERHDGRVRTSPGDFIPFGYGARSCIGAHLSSQIATCVIEAFCSLPSCGFLDSEPEGPEFDPKINVLKSRTGFRIQI